MNPESVVTEGEYGRQVASLAVVGGSVSGTQGAASPRSRVSAFLGDLKRDRHNAGES